MKSAAGILFLWAAVVVAAGQELTADMEDFWKVLQKGALAKITLHIIDEDGRPVEQANIGAHFQIENRAGIAGQSGEDGQFVLEDLTRGQFHYGVEKAGYYPTRSEMKLIQEGVMIKDGKWQPWNQKIQVVLRRMKNPIPMYAKKVEIQIPVLGEEVGYDLLVGDWVNPHGQGKCGDFRVVLSRQIERIDRYEGNLSVAFDAPHCGLQIAEDHATNSAFRAPRLAPLAGYANSWSNQFGYESARGYYGRVPGQAAAIYFMRTRQKLDEDGNLQEALYGKFHGAISVRGIARPELPTLSFTYYLNPTPNDRNMEFDPKRNLFGALRVGEEVREP